MIILKCSKQEGFYSISLTGTKEWSDISFNPLTMEIIVWRKRNTCNAPPMPEKYDYKEFLKNMDWEKEFAPSVYNQKLKIVKRIGNKMKSGNWEN